MVTEVVPFFPFYWPTVKWLKVDMWVEQINLVMMQIEVELYNLKKQKQFLCFNGINPLSAGISLFLDLGY